MASITTTASEGWALRGTRAPSAEVLVAAAGAGVLALVVPLHTVVLGLVVFGILHNAFELRYVLGRFHDVLHGRFLVLMVAAVSTIALRRLLVPGDPGLLLEIVLGYAVLVAALLWAARHRRVLLAAGTGVLGVATAASIAFPAMHFVVITHLHNLVPLAFLWEWSSRLPHDARRRFRAVQLTWLLGVPLALLLGTADALLPSLPAHFAGLHVADLAGGYTPPILREAGAWSRRFLVVFGFLQAMHYYVWCVFLPRHAPDAAAEFDRAVPIGRRFGGRRLVAGAAVGAVALGAVFWADYTTGRSIYLTVSTYHAYLEWPVILALVLGLRQPAPSQGSPSPGR